MRNSQPVCPRVNNSTVKNLQHVLARFLTTRLTTVAYLKQFSVNRSLLCKYEDISVIAINRNEASACLRRLTSAVCVGLETHGRFRHVGGRQHHTSPQTFWHVTVGEKTITSTTAESRFCCCANSQAAMCVTNTWTERRVGHICYY